MMNKSILFAFIFALLASDAAAQQELAIPDAKQRFYATWGYNRAYYNRSDIHFQGEGFDFTLKQVVATDVPEEWDAKVYLNPVMFTVPQFNFRLGYFLNDKVTISGGWDHMKYKLLGNQVVRIDGFIDPQVFEEDAGKYNDELFQVTPGFMAYEHSDGFNFVRIGLERREEFWHSNNEQFSASVIPGISAGFMFPWTDFTFMGSRYRNWVHLSGWGVSGTLAARFEWRDLLFIQGQAQFGYSHMGDILLQNEASSRADQSIVFFERSLSLGAYIPIGKKQDS